MVITLYQLFKTFSLSSKKKLIIAQVNAVLLSFLEIAMVSSMSLYMAELINVNNRDFSGFSYLVKSFLIANSDLNYSVILAIITLFFITVTNFFSMFQLWYSVKVSNAIGAEVSQRMFRSFLCQSYKEYLERKLPSLSNDVVVEANRLTNFILLPTLVFISRSLVILGFIIALLLIDIFSTLGISIIFLFFYYIVYFFTKEKLQLNGAIITEANEKRFKSVDTVNIGFRDILLNKVADLFYSKFKNYCHLIVRAQSNNAAIGMAPRYLIEWIVFGGVVTAGLFMLLNNMNLDAHLPAIAFFALAGYKLLPSFQNAYGALTTIKGNLNVVFKFKETLDTKIRNFYQNSIIVLDPPEKDFAIKLNNVSFRYSGNQNLVLSDVSLTIKRGEIIGIIGRSGSGKSTLLDLMVGFLIPERGKIHRYSNDKDPENLNWFDKVSVVSQEVVLLDSSLAENIAFGHKAENIDLERVISCLRAADLEDYVPKNDINQIIAPFKSDWGFSGGQKQRIAIARALYQKSQVLFFDEFTSSLDAESEDRVCQVIEKMRGIVTVIIVGHKERTIRHCDQVYQIKKGSLKLVSK